VSTDETSLSPIQRSYWQDEAPDPLDVPGLYEGVRLRRIFAYLIDLVIIGALLLLLWFVGMFFVALTLGLLYPVLMVAMALVPFLYHATTIGGYHDATVGMRLMDLRVVAWDGYSPGYAQAALQTILFYASIALTNTLILLVSLFNARGRCLHDFFAGTVVINDDRPY